MAISPHGPRLAPGTKVRNSLHQHRLSLRLTQADVGRSLAMSDRWCSGVERGEINPPPETRRKLAEIYKLSPAELDKMLREAQGMAAGCPAGLNDPQQNCLPFPPRSGSGTAPTSSPGVTAKPTPGTGSRFRSGAGGEEATHG